MKKRKVSSTGKFSFTPSSTSDQLGQSTSRMFYGWADNSSTCITPFGSLSDETPPSLNGEHFAGIWYTTRYGDPEDITIDFRNSYYDEATFETTPYRYLRLINHTHGVSIPLLAMEMNGMPVTYKAGVSHSINTNDIHPICACLTDKSEQVWEITYEEYEVKGVVKGAFSGDVNTDNAVIKLVRGADFYNLSISAGEVVYTFPYSLEGTEIAVQIGDVLYAPGAHLSSSNISGIFTGWCNYRYEQGDGDWQSIIIADVEEGFELEVSGSYGGSPN